MGSAAPESRGHLGLKVSRFFQKTHAARGVLLDEYFELGSQVRKEMKAWYCGAIFNFWQVEKL